MPGQDLAFLRKAAKIQDVTGCDEPIQWHLMELAPRWLEMERRIDVGAGVAHEEHRFREEPVDLARRPLSEPRRRIRGEHLRVRPDRLRQVDDARESDRPRLRSHDATSVAEGRRRAYRFSIWH